MSITLGRLGKDIFDNSVDYTDYGGDNYSISVQEAEQKAPTFIVHSETSRGNIITATYSKYNRE